MNKLITTTSTGYFSTNYFRTLRDTNAIWNSTRQQHIFFPSNDPSTVPFYRIGFNYTNSLILSPGIYAWHPGTPSYTYPKFPATGNSTTTGFGTGLNGTNNSGLVLELKNMQLPKDQYIRVLSFTFEGYNTKYSLNTNGLGLPTGAKTNFQIVFGFGNNRVFQTGPWDQPSENTFIKCYEVTTETITVGQAAGNVLDIFDLSLNTYFNSSTNPLTNTTAADHKPIDNKAIKTSYTTGNPTNGTLTGTSFTPYNFSTSGNETLSLIVDGTAQNININFNCDPSFNFISNLNSVLTGATVSEFNGFLRITSDTTGTSSSVELSVNNTGSNAQKLLYDPVNQPVPAGVPGASSFIYNDLQPYIFIRAMDATNNVPWTTQRLTDAGASLFFRSWTLTNRIRTQYGEKVPISDLPWTCPFGAQFQFEHYIPAPGGQ